MGVNRGESISGALTAACGSATGVQLGTAFAAGLGADCCEAARLAVAGGRLRCTTTRGRAGGCCFP